MPVTKGKLIALDNKCTEGVADGTSDPVINSVNPAVSPLAGGAMIKITGQHFDAGSTLKIDGKPVTARLSKDVNDEMALVFSSPPMQTDGFKLIQVTTSKGKQVVLDNTLYYFPDQPTHRESTRVWGKH